MRKLLAFLILAAGLAFGQGAQRTPPAMAAVDYLGNLKVLSGATVTVCPASGSVNNCTPGTIHLFRDVGLTIPLTNPLHADANGNYTYYITPGTYGERICSPSVTCQFNLVTLVAAPGGVGTCESLGATPGDLCYFNGSAWVILSGNTGQTTQWLQETGSGVPSWTVPPDLIISVTGTVNQIDVTAGSTPVVSLDPQFTVNSYGTCTNTADALTLTPADAPTALANGLTVTCKSSAANTTTTPTLNVNSLGPKTVVKAGVSGQAALVASDILTNMVATFKYNAATTTWELQNPQQGVAIPGLTNVIVPSAEFASSILGTVETVTKQNQNQGTAWMGPTVGTTPTPTVVQDVFCNINSGTSVPCSFPAGVGAGNFYWIEALESGDGVATFTVSDGVDTFTILTNGNYLNTNSILDAYSKNVAGGSPVITVGTSGTTITGRLLVHMVEIAGLDKTSPFDAQSAAVLQFEGPTNFGTLTTGNANDLVIASMGIGGGSACSSTVSPGFALIGQSAVGPSYLVTEYANFTTTGDHTPLPYVATCGGSWYNQNQAFAFKAATTFNSNQPFFRHQIFSDWWWALPGLYGLTPASTAGDTQIDLHVGTPIEATAVTGAYAGNDTASKLAVVGGASAAYHCWVNATCHTQVATATVIPKLNYTDSSNTAETIIGGTATCTTIGTNSVSYNVWPIHAYPSTSIYLETTLANSPHYDVHAVCELANTQ